MITKLFNAKILYQKNINIAKKKINKLYKNYKKYPHTAELIIDNNFATNLYIKNKIKYFNKINIIYSIFKFSKDIKLQSIILLIKIINNNKKINAILLQLPIPTKIKKNILFKKINIKKDLDMLNPISFARYITGYTKYSTCTSQSIINILKLLNIKVNNLKIILFGFSNIIGKPILFNLFKENATISIINEKFKHFKNIFKNTDIIIIAIGCPNFLNLKNIPYGCTIIDIGINITKGKMTIGDFQVTKKINKHLSYLTPVPGGIGLITINNLSNKIIKITKQQGR